MHKAYIVLLHISDFLKYKKLIYYYFFLAISADEIEIVIGSTLAVSMIRMQWKFCNASCCLGSSSGLWQIEDFLDSNISYTSSKSFHNFLVKICKILLIFVSLNSLTGA